MLLFDLNLFSVDCCNGTSVALAALTMTVVGATVVDVVRTVVGNLLVVVGCLSVVVKPTI